MRKFASQFCTQQGKLTLLYMGKSLEIIEMEKRKMHEIVNSIDKNLLKKNSVKDSKKQLVSIKIEKIANKIINIALCVIIFLIPLLITPREVDIIPYNLLKICVLLVCGAILLICLIIIRKKLKFDLIDKTLIVLFILTLLSTIFSINPSTALIGDENRYEGFLSLTVYFLTYYCAKYFFSYNKKLKIFATITVSITAIIGILQYYNIFPLYYIFNIPFVSSFASSTFGNRNFFGNFMAIVVPTFMGLYIIKNRKTYLILCFLSFWGMLVSMTRSSWVGLAVATIIGIIYVIKNFNMDILKRVLSISIGFIVIFIFVLTPPTFITENFSGNNSINNLNSRLELIGKDVENLLNNNAGSAGSGRISIWILTLKSIAITPLLGTGPDTLKDALIINVHEEAIERMIKTHTIVDKAHNEYLQIAATIGVPALIVYLAFIFQIIFSRKDVFTNNSTFILFVGIISYLVQAFFNISTIGVAPVFWFLLGLLQNEKFKGNMIE